MIKCIMATLVAVSLATPSLAAALLDENLLAPVPSGFKVGYTTDNGRAQFTEFVPRGETVKDWSSMLTVRVDYALKAAPDRYAQSLAKLWAAACPGGAGVKVTSGKENGYPFTVWLYECDLNPQTGKPETMELKAIAGSDSFYQVQYAYRQAATANLVQKAATYLRSVSVCDTRKTDRACPKSR